MITDESWLKGEFMTTVQKRGAAIIEARGASSAARRPTPSSTRSSPSPTPTPEGNWHSVAVCSKGEYGTPEGLVVGFPIRTNADGSYEIVHDIEHNDYAEEKFRASVTELEEEREAVAGLLESPVG